MSRVYMVDIYHHPIAQKYLRRSGLAHAVACAYNAFALAERAGVDADAACKAAFLHDIGHYTWYQNGSWDYEQYRRNDIHAIKGAERAHKLLIRLGEDPEKAKEISLAVLFHTDSFLPDPSMKKDKLQEVVAAADEADEEPGGAHHYRKITDDSAVKSLTALDTMLTARCTQTAASS
ncbi:HD domain-containing protein [Alkalicoccus chagannorensis]|uniref:HD domain-containing protein n=1 Tax=Alkalicoccus chagannorensis TaxID=427072 RepID=UPI00041C46FE|nr:HD domain-containing protein [Alkalicoccus chagannorensis]